eukprot:343730_1
MSGADLFGKFGSSKPTRRDRPSASNTASSPTPARLEVRALNSRADEVEAANRILRAQLDSGEHRATHTTAGLNKAVVSRAERTAAGYSTGIFGSGRPGDGAGTRVQECFARRRR